jgi:hypothetical protein
VQQIPDYLLQIGREPTPELVERVTMARRGPPLTKEEIIYLEDKQNRRCALCGTFLDKQAHPHVDHVVPVALGGKSDLSNLQLLCHQCNVGKGSLLAWVVGVPFQTRRITYRLRYCVLARAGGKCQLSGCKHSSKNSDLLVTPRIAQQRGGPLVLDNLEALCSMHHAARMSQNRLKGINSLKLKKLSRVLGTLYAV